MQPGPVLTPVTVRAPAKLTRSLRVTGRRADGYHLIEAEMITLDLVDELTFSDVDSDVDVAVDGDGLEVSGAVRDVPAGRENLVCRALAAVGRRARVRLRKRIPAGAGLGGGAADAAAVLRWAGCHDLAVALSLGADVPFCLSGGRARVSGVGEVVEPLALENRAFTLLVPPFGVSTAAVYRAWDALGGPAGDGANDLEPAALAVEPRLAEWRERLEAATGLTPTLAGSGATWFVEGAFPGDERVVTSTGDC